MSSITLYNTADPFNELKGPCGLNGLNEGQADWNKAVNALHRSYMGHVIKGSIQPSNKQIKRVEILNPNANHLLKRLDSPLVYYPKLFNPNPNLHILCRIQALNYLKLFSKGYHFVQVCICFLQKT